MSTTRLITILRIAITTMLAIIGAAAGFTHTHDWAVHNGQTGWLAWADAVVIEGMAVVAGFELRRDHHAGNTRRVSFPAVVLVVSFALQMTAQVALAPATPAGWLLAATPALGFLIVVKLLLRHTPTSPPSTSHRPTPAAMINEERSVDAVPAPDAKSLTKLPAPLRSALTEATTQAHLDGRLVTEHDVAHHVTLPAPLTASLVAELNASVNHYPAT